MPSGGRLTISTTNVLLEAGGKGEEDGHAERAVGVAGAAGSFVMLAVSDTGCGMDESVRSHLFEPFFTTKEQGKGTGLGLATVYGIVKQSEGYIDIDNALGQGTTFRLYFPRVDAPVEESAAAVPQASRAGTETVLLVEDEEALRDLVATMLRERGHTVLEADCGAAALEIARGHIGNIDLLLTDVIMPGITGRQVAREISRERPTIHVIFMSGHSDEALGARGVLDPGTVLLPKPFNGHELDTCLRLVLDAAGTSAERIPC
jgi:CheY-like chemotaxis protein